MGKSTGLRILNACLLSFSLISSQITLAASDSSGENRPGVETAKNASDVVKSLDEKKDPNHAKHKSAIEKCKEEVTKADQMCAASQNPSSQQAQNNMNSYTSANSGSSASSGGQAGRCGGFGDLMKGIQPLMGNYNQQCEKARNNCKSTCKKETETAKKSCDTIQGKDANDTKEKQEACKKNAQLAESYAKTVDKSCTSYEQNAMQALAMLAAAGTALASMLQCQEDQGVNCTENPMDPSCQTDQAAQNTQNCTLTADPNTCIRADAGALAGMVGKERSDSSDVPTAAGLDAGGSGGLVPNNRAGSSGSMPFAPGGGGGIGSGRGGVDSAKQDAAAGTKPIDPNILAGEYGGGGGGRGVAGGGYPDAPTSGGLGSALKNADMRKMGANGPLTGGNGRSNWQKVNERYRDNSPSLNAVSQSR